MTLVLGHKMQRTPPTTSANSNNTNNITGLIFDNNNTLQSTNSSTHITEILTCSAKLPPFWSDCPETWFIQAEAQSLRNVSHKPHQSMSRSRLLCLKKSLRPLSILSDILRPKTNIRSLKEFQSEGIP